MDQITAKAGPSVEYAKAPEGQHQCVLVDVIDLRMHENSYMGESKGMVHKCALVFQVDEVNPDTGKRFEMSKDFTVSMHEKANLRKFLAMWRGKSYTDKEAEEGAPLHKLEGVNGLMTIEHRQSKQNPERTYANIISVTPMFKGTQKITPEKYTRAPYWEDRIGVSAETLKPTSNGNGNDLPAELEDQDDDLPF